MHPTRSVLTRSVLTRFDFDVVTGPVEPLPIVKPLHRPLSDAEPATDASGQGAPTDPAKPRAQPSGP